MPVDLEKVELPLTYRKASADYERLVGAVHLPAFTISPGDTVTITSELSVVLDQEGLSTPRGNQTRLRERRVFSERPPSDFPGPDSILDARVSGRRRRPFRGRPVSAQASTTSSRTWARARLR